MVDVDVSLQLQQMVAFIRQEALEKAQEISVSCEEEFNILKQQILETEQRKIKQEYERKEKQMEIRKKIEYSMQLNNSRLRVLQAQDDLVQDIKKGAQKQIYDFSSNQRAYKNLIKDLIVQGLIKLKEPFLVLQCRHADLGLVKSVLQLAKDRYAAKMKAHPPDVVVDEKIFLPADDESSPLGRTWYFLLAFFVCMYVIIYTSLNFQLGCMLSILIHRGVCAFQTGYMLAEASKVNF
eukprot:c18027_g1_i2 orf=2190-2900(-)